MKNDRMKNQIDRTLINAIAQLAKKEKKIKEFKSRVRVKGKLIRKGKTKKGNIKLIVEKGENTYNLVVMSTHQEKYALAEQLKVGSFVSAAGINKFRAIICTQLRKAPKTDESKQAKLIM